MAETPSISRHDPPDALPQHALGRHRQPESVSAMPSMHVGIAVLLAILGFASGETLARWSLAGFAGVNLRGFHFAWLAITRFDGYLGWQRRSSCWWLAGKLVKCRAGSQLRGGRGALT